MGDAAGLPLAVAVTGANRHDRMLIESMLDALPAVQHRRGRPRRRPDTPHADKGYDNQRVRTYLRRCGITARIARRGVEPANRLGRHRWVVKCTISWLLHHRRLALRYDRTATRMTAVANLACTLICARRLPDP